MGDGGAGRTAGAPNPNQKKGPVNRDQEDAEETMKSRILKGALAGAAILILAPLAAPLLADEPVVMLRVDVNGTDKDTPKIRVTVPLSLIEVVIESVDTSEVMHSLKTEKGIDIKKLWRELKNADVDEFVTVEKGDKKVKVYKERDTFRVSVQEESYDSPNIELRIPFTVMDYLTEEHKEGFKLSEMIEGLRAQLPLTIIEAHHDGDNVKVWLEEK